MTISTDYSGTTSQTNTAQTNTSQSGSATAITSDFQTFLTMLTTQLQNQDPLNPMESSEFAVQLATFSGVEQQMQTNTLLTSLSSQLGVIGMSQLAAWVGQEARAEVPVYFDGTAVTLAPEPDGLADSAVLVVRDARGNLVTREDITVGTSTYQWLGSDAAGEPLATGTYQLSLESWRGEKLLGTSGISSYSRIVEVRGGSGGTTLILPGGIEVASGAVTALRQP